MSFKVYVLQSEVTGRSYVGSCENLDKRLWQQNQGHSKATKHGVPWKLVYSESFETRQDAVRRERDFKTGKGRGELKAMIRENRTA